MKYGTQPSVPGMPGNNQHFQFDGQAGLASLNQVRGPEVKTPIHYGAAPVMGNGNAVGDPTAHRTTIIPALNPESRNRSTEGFLRSNPVSPQGVPYRPYQQGSNGMPGGIGNAAWCD